MRGVFHGDTACRDANPVGQVEEPDVVEKAITPLELDEVERLEETARQQPH